MEGPWETAGPMVSDLVFVLETPLQRASRAEPGLLRTGLRAWVVDAGPWRAVNERKQTCHHRPLPNYR